MMHVGVWFCSVGDYTLVSEAADEIEDRSEAGSVVVAAASSVGSAGTAASAAPDGPVGFTVLIGPDREPIAPSAGPPQFDFPSLTDAYV